jgi:hypothetical protein
LSRVDRVQKIMDREQRTDIGKYSFVNRTIKKLKPTTCRNVRGFSLVNLRFLESYVRTTCADADQDAHFSTVLVIKPRLTVHAPASLLGKPTGRSS